MKPNTMRGIFALIGVLILVVIAYKVVYPMFKKRKEKFYSGPQVTVAYYFMPGCGHCQSFDKSGEWSKFIEDSQKVDFATITPVKKDGTNADNVDPAHKDIVKRGFPAFVIDKGNGNVTSYDKLPRTSAAILEATKAFVAA